MKSMKDELSKLILKVTDLQSKLSLTCQCLKEEIEKRSISETSQNTLMKQFLKLSFRSKLSVCVEKLSHLSTRNDNKRINIQKNHVALLKQAVASQEEKIENFEEEAKELKKNLKKH